MTEWAEDHAEFRTEALDAAVELAARAMVPTGQDPDRPHGDDRDPLWTFFEPQARLAVVASATALFESAAQAIEAEFKLWCAAGGTVLTDFPLHSPQWLVKRSHEMNAATVRTFMEERR